MLTLFVVFVTLLGVINLISLALAHKRLDSHLSKWCDLSNRILKLERGADVDSEHISTLQRSCADLNQLYDAAWGEVSKLQMNHTLNAARVDDLGSRLDSCAKGALVMLDEMARHHKVLALLAKNCPGLVEFVKDFDRRHRGDQIPPTTPN